MKYLISLLAAVALGVVSGNVKSFNASDACLECSDTCALLAPTNFPCYQGDPKHANLCFNTDPVLPDGETWVCGTCTENGYDTYIQNDPIYTNMELWGKGTATYELPRAKVKA